MTTNAFPQAPKSLQVENVSLQVAGFEVLPVPTGIFGLDGGAMFGTVPKVLWSKSNPSDDLNRIPMEARALLLKSKEKNILIDCGNGSDFIAKYGEKLGGKFADMYAIDENGPSLLKSLAHYGLKPDDIDHVILTHLHFDHCGGGVAAKRITSGGVATTSTSETISETLVPTFPKATYWVQKGNLELAQNPNIREKASYLPANFQPLLDHQVLRLLEPNQKDFIPGLQNLQIDAYVSHGHTGYHQSIVISDKSSSSASSQPSTTIVYCGDLIPTSSHVRLAWVMGYDLSPLTLIEEKKRLLSQSTSNWYLFFEHDPYCDVATVTSNNGDFAVTHRFHLK